MSKTPDSNYLCTSNCDIYLLYAHEEKPLRHSPDSAGHLVWLHRNKRHATQASALIVGNIDDFVRDLARMRVYCETQMGKQMDSILGGKKGIRFDSARVIGERAWPAQGRRRDQRDWPHKRTAQSYESTLCRRHRTVSHHRPSPSQR